MPEVFPITMPIPSHKKFRPLRVPSGTQALFRFLPFYSRFLLVPRRAGMNGSLPNSTCRFCTSCAVGSLFFGTLLASYARGAINEALTAQGGQRVFTRTAGVNKETQRPAPNEAE